ncbi:vacuolar-processing enzyme-like isoform X1 [Olea europaea var. sylvestris]|uniref:vacuolar-processing enzyme-like isoform X1 n=1 Tax=Olea europaea var. sylvestris TaxID=158386 RepID=UPI000C1CCFD7|nr:vacuolar-processing enzyme-like isoform X1 [Olea europaea var. sylvestris]XP_022865382.1 vacuolar-processing enzyme-like isoform X1 [Olea europaea var. sylvestris]
MIIFSYTMVIMVVLECLVRRTANQNSFCGSHVMQYGDLKLSAENLFLHSCMYPANDNQSFVDNNAVQLSSKAVYQPDANLLHFWHKFIKAPEGSLRKFEAQKELADAMTHRTHIDSSIKLIGSNPPHAF